MPFEVSNGVQKFGSKSWRNKPYRQKTRQDGVGTSTFVRNENRQLDVVQILKALTIRMGSSSANKKKMASTNELSLCGPHEVNAYTVVSATLDVHAYFSMMSMLRQK